MVKNRNDWAHIALLGVLVVIFGSVAYPVAVPFGAGMVAVGLVGWFIHAWVDQMRGSRSAVEK